MQTQELTRKSLEVQLQDYFAPFEEQATQWLAKAKEINVTDESQVELMESAREARLALKSIRVDVNKKHAELKEDALRTGQILDKIRRGLVGLIEPIEKHLQEQEDFIEILKEKKKKELFEVRVKELSSYMSLEEARMIPLGEMSETAFTNFKNGYKHAQEEEKKTREDAIKAEQKRIAEQRAETERLQKENAKLQAERDKKDALFKKEQAARRELQEQAEAKQAEIDRLARERAAAERKAKRAPDKEKLLALAKSIRELPVPEIKEPEGKIILDGVKNLLMKINNYILTQTNAL